MMVFKARIRVFFLTFLVSFLLSQLCFTKGIIVENPVNKTIAFYYTTDGVKILMCEETFASDVGLLA